MRKVYIGGHFIRKGFLERFFQSCYVLGWYKGTIKFLCGHLGIYLGSYKLCTIKHRIIEGYLRENYTLTIKEIEDVVKEVTASRKLEKKERIWVFWYQGEKSMPEVVRMCYHYLKANNTSGSREVLLLSKYNIDKYIGLPEYIICALAEKRLSLAHYSDIIRMALLYYYGGMWLDATILCPRPIDVNLFNVKYWTYKSKEYDNYNWFHVVQGRWSLSIRNADQPYEELFKIVLAKMLMYWKREKYLLDYMWMDYFFDIVYYDYPHIKNEVDAIECNNPYTNKLVDIIEKELDEDQYHSILESTNFFKLTHKHEFSKEIHGKETLYGYLLKNMPSL